MKLFSSKAMRSVLLRFLFFLPRPVKGSIDRWIRGKKDFQKLKRADFVIVSLPKSGRTWLRVMLSRYFQQKLGLPEHSVIGFDNFHKLNPAAPCILFTHDSMLRDYTGNLDSKKDFYDKKVILLVRDLRDLVVSQFHQWRYRVAPTKLRLHSMLDTEADVGVFDFAMNTHHGIPRNIRFLNEWQEELHRVKDVLVVKYEDMRADPDRVMSEVLSFVGEAATEQEINSVVEYAKFENMRKMEEKQTFRTESKRLFASNSSDKKRLKTRRAKVGGYTDYLTPEQIQVIDTMIQEQLSPEFGYSTRPETSSKSSG